MLLVRLGAAVCAILLLLAQRAGAEEERVALDYHAPDECPGKAAFESEVRARTAKVKFGAEGRRFRVVVDRGESGGAGTLSIREGDAAPSERTLSGAACDEVVSALALVAALAVDPLASTAPRSELVLPAEPEPEPEPAPAPKPEPAKAPVERVSSPPRPSPKPARAPAEPTQFRAGLRADLVSGPAPKPLLAGGFELFLHRKTLLGESGLGLGFFAAQTGVGGPDLETARFRWLVGRVALCPLGAGRPLYYHLCAASDLGALHAEGLAIYQPEARTRLWADAGAVAVAGCEFGPHWYAGLAAGALVNLTRDRFFFEAPPRPETVYDVPFATFFAGAGLGLAIP